MPFIGWVFLVLSLCLILGSLFMLRDSKMHIPPEKLEKIRKRKAELEAEEKEKR